MRVSEKEAAALVKAAASYPTCANCGHDELGFVNMEYRILTCGEIGEPHEDPFDEDKPVICLKCEHEHWLGEPDNDVAARVQKLWTDYEGHKHAV